MMPQHSDIAAHTVLDRLVLVTAIDRNYVVPYGVMLASFARHNPGADAEAFLIHYDLKDDDFTFLSRVSEDIGVPVTFIRIPAYPFNLFESRRRQSVKSRQTMSPITYATLFIDRFLPRDLRAVVWIDADIVVNGTMEELVGMRLSQPVAAVAKHPRAPTRDFNAGFMLVDLEAWRHWGVADISERFLLHYADALDLHDQQVMNMLFRDRWQKIGVKWNFVRNHYLYRHRQTAYSLAEVEAAAADPVIIHYAVSGRDKPWQAGSRHPHADLYRTQRTALSGHFSGLSLADPQEDDDFGAAALGLRRTLRLPRSLRRP